jgi:ATP-dependent DNA ligase I
MQPIQPMLAKKCRPEKLERVLRVQGATAAETKYDGYRVQLHTGREIAMYSRNLVPMDPASFPELIPFLRQMPAGIWDGEILGRGTRRDGFKAIEKRFKANYSPGLVEQFPLEIRLFDCMLLEGKTIMNLSLDKRRDLVERYALMDGIKESEQFIVSNKNELATLYHETVGGGLEGLVCKDLTSIYIPGGRGDEWIKLKEFDTYDLVVLGLYKGEGKLAGLPFAAVVVGTRNREGKYETITKVGLSNESKVNEIYNLIKGSLSETPPDDSVFSSELRKKSYARKIPFAYVIPDRSVVLEVEAQDVTQSKNWHTCGFDEESGKAFSLRIPSIIGLRYDKSPRDCNTTEQIKEVYGG